MTGRGHGGNVRFSSSRALSPASLSVRSPCAWPDTPCRALPSRSRHRRDAPAERRRLVDDGRPDLHPHQQPRTTRPGARTRQTAGDGADRGPRRLVCRSAAGAHRAHVLGVGRGQAPRLPLPRETGRRGDQLRRVGIWPRAGAVDPAAAGLGLRSGRRPARGHDAQRRDRQLTRAEAFGRHSVFHTDQRAAGARRFVPRRAGGSRRGIARAAGRLGGSANIPASRRRSCSAWQSGHGRGRAAWIWTAGMLLPPTGRRRIRCGRTPGR